MLAITTANLTRSALGQHRIGTKMLWHNDNIMYKEQTTWLSYIDSALRSHKDVRDGRYNICGFKQLTSVAQLHRKSCIPGLCHPTYYIIRYFFTLLSCACDDVSNHSYS